MVTFPKFITERFDSAPAATPTDLDSLISITTPLGRDQIPGLMAAWEARGILTADLLRLILKHAWGSPEYPEDDSEAPFWIGLFRRAGFISDGEEPPTGDLKVYRGVRDGRGFIRRMSWNETSTLRIGLLRDGVSGRTASMKQSSRRKASWVVFTHARGPFTAAGEPEVVVDPSFL